MFKVPEKYRITDHRMMMATDESYKNNGAFEIPLSGRSVAYVIASDGEGWDHVSVHAHADGRDKTPTWAQMCKIKDLFWSEDDCVIQYHPPKADYVNNHKHTLHLWRPTIETLPKPNPLMIGMVTG